MQAYQTNRPINRPVLTHLPWWPTDLQALPPRGWCPRCGAEIYAPTAKTCPRCKDSGQLTVDS